MTWGEFKAAVEARGAMDETPVAFGQDLYGGVYMKVYRSDYVVEIDPNDPKEN